MHDVTESYRKCCMDDLLDPPELFDMATQFMRKPFPILLQGLPGTGKTHFMFSVIHQLLNDKMPLHAVRWISADRLDNLVNLEMKKYGSCLHFFEKMIAPDMLFIDDFGLEPDKNKLERNYYSILDKRLSDNKATVISTNLNDNEILNRFGLRITSRLKQCIRLKFEHQDRRKPYMVG